MVVKCIVHMYITAEQKPTGFPVVFYAPFYFIQPYFLFVMPLDCNELFLYKMPYLSIS